MAFRLRRVELAFPFYQGEKIQLLAPQRPDISFARQIWTDQTAQASQKTTRSIRPTDDSVTKALRDRQSSPQ